MKNPYLFNAIIAAVYIVSGYFARVITISPEYATPVWPAAGISLAVFILAGWRAAPGIWLGSFVFNVLASFEYSKFSGAALVASGLIGLGAVLQVFAGNWLIRLSSKTDLSLQRVGDITRIIFIGGAVACLVNAVIGPAVLTLFRLTPPEHFWINTLNWWVGDVLGVILCTPLTMLLLNAGVPSTFVRKATVAGALVATLLFAAFGMTSVQRLEEQRRENFLNNYAAETAPVIKQAFRQPLRAVAAIDGLFSAYTDVSRVQFETFVERQFAVYDGLYGVSLNYKVAASERAAFEQRMRARGYAGFSIQDRTMPDVLVPAATRPLYFPISYVYPPVHKSSILGFDIYGYDLISGDLRTRTLDHARDTGLPQTTGPIPIVQKDKKPIGLIIYHPIYRAGQAVETVDDRRNNLIAFATGVFVLQDILKPLMTRMEVRAGRGQKEAIGLQLSDMEAAAGQQIIFDSRLFSLEKDSDASPLPRAGLTVHDFDYVGRRLRLTFFYLDDDDAIVEPRWTVWFSMVISLLCCGLLTSFVLLMTAQTDLARRRVNEKNRQLRVSEDRYRLLVEGVRDYAIYMLDKDGVILSWNAGSELVHGYAAHEIVGQNFAVLYPPEDRMKNLPGRMLAECAAAGKHEGEGLQMRKNGRNFWAGAVTSSLYDPAGNLIGFVKVTRNIEERKKATDEREFLISKLSAANEELAQFAYIATHDLQEPLRMITSFTTLLSREAQEKLDGASVKYLGIISGAAQKMSALIRDVLEYSRLGHAGESPVIIQPGEEMAFVLENLHEAIQERDAEIHVEPLPPIQASPARFISLMQNLIGNALKYHKPGQRPVIHVGAEDRGDEWRFYVKDNGIGIKADYIEQIFQPFRRLHTDSAMYPGTGIGLALCQKIVMHMGGRLWAVSEENQGSTFFFTVKKMP
jgi:PAS domain S-box-containing protein